MSPHNDTLVNEYIEFLTKRICEKGIQPFGLSRLKKDDGLALRRDAPCASDGAREVFALAVGPEESAELFWQTIGMAPADKQREELLWGWDIATKPDQGTEFADAFVFVHWARIPGKKLAVREAFRVGVLNYQNEPRVVRPVDWNNQHWTQWILGFLQAHRPPFLMHFMDKEEADAMEAAASAGKMEQ